MILLVSCMTIQVAKISCYSMEVEKKSFLGKDATQAFEDIGHSARARDLLKEFYVGKLVEITISRQLTR